MAGYIFSASYFCLLRVRGKSLPMPDSISEFPSPYWNTHLLFPASDIGHHLLLTGDASMQYMKDSLYNKCYLGWAGLASGGDDSMLSPNCRAWHTSASFTEVPLATRSHMCKFSINGGKTSAFRPAGMIHLGYL